MVLLDKYTLLRNVTHLANSATIPYPTKLRSTVNLISSFFNDAPVVLYLLDEERRRLSLKISSIAEPESPCPCCIPIGEGVAGSCAASKKPCKGALPDLHPDEACTNTPLSAVAAFPITDGKKLYGVLSLSLPEGAGLSGVDREVLQDILPAVAGIIRHMATMRRLERRWGSLATLNDLAKVLNKTLPLRQLLPLILQSCQRLSGSCCTIIRLFAAKEGEEDALFRKTRIRHQCSLGSLTGLEKELSVRVAATGVTMMEPGTVGGTLPSFIVIPLLFEGRMQGTLTFFGRCAKEGATAPEFVDEDRELFEHMGILIANAIEGATHHQNMVFLARENERKFKELSLLNRISNIMLSTIKLNKLMTLILTALTSGTTPFFDRAMLFLVNEKSGIMQGMLGVSCDSVGSIVQPLDEDERSAVRWDLSEEDMARLQNSRFSLMVKGTRLPLDRNRNICSRAVFEKRLVHVDDVMRERIIDSEFVDWFGITSFAAAPLIAKEQVIGIVIVDNMASGRKLQRDELRLLQLFANQAGMAIENSMLYNRLKDANRELCDAQERLIQGERLAAIGEMAASIAHELKTPLVSIGGFARRLAKKLAPGSDEDACAETIIREVTRLELMLSDILSYSRKTTICFTACNVSEIVEDSLNLVANSLEESNICVKREIARDIPDFQGDRQQLKQVFLNLFFNAQEAMKSGGELHVSVYPCEFNRSRGVSVKISDSGGGIPVEILNNIFNPFFTTKATGTGLGLPIVHRIVTNHLGKIEVRNRKGEGADFIVMLPLPAEPGKKALSKSENLG